MSKLCVDCKYCYRERCIRNVYRKKDLVTGNQTLDGSEPCFWERKAHPILDYFFDFCGPEGKYYEEK